MHWLRSRVGLWLESGEEELPLQATDSQQLGHAASSMVIILTELLRLLGRSSYSSKFRMAISLSLTICQPEASSTPKDRTTSFSPGHLPLFCQAWLTLSAQLSVSSECSGLRTTAEWVQSFLGKVKGKGLPQQAEVAQGFPGRLRPRIFLTFGTTRVVGRQPYAPAAFTPEGIPDTHF